MFKLITFFFHDLPLILAWLYLAVAFFYIVMHVKDLKQHAKAPVRQWFFAILDMIYIVFFLVTFFLFPKLWDHTFSMLGLLAIFISFIWLRYEDRRTGKRWWNW